MKKIIHIIAVSFAITFQAAAAFATVSDVIPVGGVLTDKEGTPLDGLVEVTFAIYYAKTGGTRIWQEDLEVNINNGVFFAYLGDVEPLDLLDFVEHDEIWIGITVGDDSEAERILIASVPFAIEAQYCHQVVDTKCADAEYLQGWTHDAGTPICTPLRFSDLDNVPPEISDGGAFAPAVHTHDTLYEGKHKRTIIVSPVGDGQNTVANGDALFTALGSIVDASETNPYLLRIEPGIYKLEESGGAAKSLVMKQWVDIEGSGEKVTQITSKGFNSNSEGTVQLNSNCELRFVSVVNTGGTEADNSYQAIAIISEAVTGASIHKVTAQANSASRAYPIRIFNSSIFLNNVNAIADASTYSFGIWSGYSTVELLDTYSVATSTDGMCAGLRHDGAENLTIRGGSYQAISSNIGNSYGLWIYSTHAKIYNAELLAYGGTLSRGIKTDAANLTLVNSKLVSSNDDGAWGIHCQNQESIVGTFELNIKNSRIQSNDEIIKCFTNFTVNLANSQLDGDAIDLQGATMNCFGNYDGNYGAYSCV